MLNITDEWKAAYPDTCVGILVMRNVANPKSHAGLDALKSELESEIRDKYEDADRAAIRALEPIAAYNHYYKRHRKTYHVQLQLESVAFKGKSIPSVAGLVEVMFMAELKNLLLTAVHDLDLVQSPITLNIATGEETYTMINGKEQQTRKGDMIITDSEGIMSSIIYGPDSRTRITPNTTNALFTVYGTPCISPESIDSHLQDIEAYAKVISAEAETELLQIYEL